MRRTYRHLDAEPFGKWLRGVVREDDVTEWAERRGVDAQSIRRIRRGTQRRVHIDTVDRALLWADTNIRDLYPELSDDEAIAA